MKTELDLDITKQLIEASIKIIDNLGWKLETLIVNKANLEEYWEYGYETLKEQIHTNPDQIVFFNKEPNIKPNDYNPSKQYINGEEEGWFAKISRDDGIYWTLTMIQDDHNYGDYNNPPTYDAFEVNIPIEEDNSFQNALFTLCKTIFEMRFNNDMYYIV